MIQSIPDQNPEDEPIAKKHYNDTDGTFEDLVSLEEDQGGDTIYVQNK